MHLPPASPGLALHAGPPTSRRRKPGAALVLALALASSCSKSPPRKEWSPSDHVEPQAELPAAASAPTAPRPASVTASGDAVWDSTCAPCHGPRGKGDGPASTGLNVQDLSHPTWQSAQTDEQIATAIRTGKGRMPSFAFPDNTVAALVRKIRSFRQ